MSPMLHKGFIASEVSPGCEAMPHHTGTPPESIRAGTRTRHTPLQSRSRYWQAQIGFRQGTTASSSKPREGCVRAVVCQKLPDCTQSFHSSKLPLDISVTAPLLCHCISSWSTGGL